jgi:ribosomal protein S18 acetylase RimI-like enzyme
MPRLSSKDQIRSLLNLDPRWCVYAIGDLSDRMFAKCQWFTPDLTLVLHDYDTSILFGHGTRSIREALDHCTFPVHLQVKQDAFDEVARYARVSNVKRMLRMGWEGADKTTRAAEGANKNTRAAESADSSDIKRLTDADVEALKRLYADGESTGESPDFFYDSMVTDGVFAGVYDGDELIAVTGTHLVSRDEGAAALGNVYVRRDRRGKGLSRLTTAAVLDDLRGIRTIGLNVRADNAVAIRVYESLGFVTHCPFIEAIATR